MSHLLAASGVFRNPVINSTVGQLPNSTAGIPVLQTYLVNGINLGFLAGGVILLFVLLRGGVGFITAGADKEANQQAQKRMSSGFIGIAILLSVYALIYLVGRVLGVSIFNLNIPRLQPIS